jgi:hypothetical protein
LYFAEEVAKAVSTGGVGTEIKDNKFLVTIGLESMRGS